MSPEVAVALFHSGRSLPPWLPDGVEVSCAEADGGGIDLAKHTVAVLDATSLDALGVARRVRARDVSIHLIIVAHAEQRSTIERAITFAPGIGEVWVVDPGDLDAEALRTGSEITRQRREYRLTRQQVQQSLSGAKPAPRAPVFVSDAYLAALLQVLPDPVLSIDAEDHVLSWSPATEHALLLERGVTGRDVVELLRPIDEPAMRRLLDEGRANAARGEIEWVRADGSVRSADLAVAAVEVAGQQIRALVLHDTTEARAAQQQLEEQAGELEAQTLQLGAQAEQLQEQRDRVAEHAAERTAVLDHVADGVILTDPHGRVTFMNAAARRIHGAELRKVPPDQLPRAYGLHTLQGEPYPADELPLLRALREREPVLDAQWMIRKPDGSETVAQGSAAPVTAPDGRLVGAVLVFRDITQAARLEQEREQLLVARDRALEDLQQVVASRSRFYASMSHEIRTPINAILGYNDLLMSGVYGDLAPDQLRGLQRAQTAARHLRELVDDVLDLSKIESGKIDVIRETVELTDLVREVVETIQPAAEERGSTLDCSWPSPISITTDPRRVRQILFNLLSNAVKFGGGNPIDVSVGRVGGGQAFVEVRDRGRGVEAAHLDSIFEEFVQIESVAEGGTGLGLPISKRLAVALGGTLAVASTVGVGSTFTLTLPLAAADAESRHADPDTETK